MKAIEQKKTSIIRIFEDDKNYGEKFVLSLFCSYYGKFNEIVYLEGLVDRITRPIMSSLKVHFKKEHIKYVRWNHTNTNGHELNICYNTETNKTTLE